ncbi:hypothetical protein PIB30_009909 [Stylosanthes scabra]|uniref:Uncharacterized protein n=1 Tax=Stylosanthes scabra TaxID=79078 RepID=A0ABU6S5P9_9FABA|nr:hypothetical protein [Stylosanthes scabra]
MQGGVDGFVNLHDEAMTGADGLRRPGGSDQVARSECGVSTSKNIPGGALLDAVLGELHSMTKKMKERFGSG